MNSVLDAVLADPINLYLRLVYADWLEEHGVKIIGHEEIISLTLRHLEITKGFTYVSKGSSFVTLTTIHTIIFNDQIIKLGHRMILHDSVVRWKMDSVDDFYWVMGELQTRLRKIGTSL